MDASREKELFEECSVSKAILQLALPTVVGQIILVVYNLADTFFIGLTRSDAMLTAVTVCMPAFMFLSAVSNLFGIGGGSVISRALGRKDRQRASQTSAFAFWGCLTITFFYSLSVWFLMDEFVDLLGGSLAEVHGYASNYLLCTVVLGGIATSMSMLLAHLIRAEGRAMLASIGIALGGVTNILLDPLFMFVILPKGQEIQGAAIATSLSNVLSVVYFFLVILASRNENSTITFHLSTTVFQTTIPVRVLATGLPACLMTFMENVSYAVLDNLMSMWGPAMQAGIGVAKKVNMLAHCIVRGITQGALPLIAYSYAARRYDRMRHSVLMAARFAISAAVVCMAANLIFSRSLISIFIHSGSEASTAGARFLGILCLGAPFSACAYTVISFFQATGEGRKSFSLALMRKGIFDIPLMFFLNDWIPAYGIVWATPIADMLCCCASLVLFVPFLRQHREDQSHISVPIK